MLTTRAIGAKIKQGYSLYTVLHTIKRLNNWKNGLTELIFKLFIINRIQLTWQPFRISYHIIFHTAKWLVGSMLQFNLSIPRKFYLHDVNIYFTLLFEPVIELFINCKHAQTICLLDQLYKLIIIAIIMMFSMSLILPSIVSL